MPGFWDFLGGNRYGIDAAEAEKTIRSKTPLLLHRDERIELAFKSAFDGREKSYLTSHRVLLKTAGLQSRSYQSIPYTSIQAFSVETAGSLDADTEVKIWSSAFGGDCKINFVKDDVDLWGVQQFMNHKVVKNFFPQGTQDPVVNSTTNTDSTNSSATNVSTLLHWLGDNASSKDPKQVEDQLKTQYPVLLQDETVELAFQGYRDFIIFTDKRILLMDVQGFTGKRVEFKTIFWQNVHGFAVETAGGFLDLDADMTIYTNIKGISKIKQDLRKGNQQVDLWAIKTCINNKVLGGDTVPLTLTGSANHDGHIDPGAPWWEKTNNRPLDPKQMNEVFHASPPVLRSQEVVEMAFKGWRDIVLFTSQRVLKVDPKGWSGKRIEYTSIPWKFILAFSVKTAGKHIDYDSEVKIWTEMDYHHGSGEDDPDRPDMACWELDFNKKLVDIIAVNKYLAMKILHANNSLSNITPLSPNIEMTSIEEQGVEKFLSKIGGDQRAIDPTQINELLHNDLPMLLDEENTIMAFKAGRDTTLFTNLRILIIDVQGWSGKKIKYKTIPYKCIRAYSVESAGEWDRDSELKLYTRNRWSADKISLDFRAGKVDILVIQKFLSAMLIGTKEDAQKYFDNANPSASATKTAMSMTHFVAWATSDTAEEDASAISRQLHTEPPILLDAETVERVYRSGRDLFVYTDLRFLHIDVQGLTGKKVQYFSVPIVWVKTFEVTTAGTLDLDAEVYLKCSITKKSKIQQDVRRNKGDVMQIHKYLTDRLIFPDAAKEALPVDEAVVS